MFFVIFATFIFMYIRIVDFNKLNYYIFTLSIVHTYIHTYIYTYIYIYIYIYIFKQLPSISAIRATIYEMT